MRLLIVDDDRALLVLLAHVVESAGHSAVVCHEPAEVPAIVARERFDAAVLDLQMPGRSGFDLLRELRTLPEARRLPVLFLSARSDSKARVEGFREGAGDFMVKPFDPEELLLRLERLVAATPPAPRAHLTSAALEDALERGAVESLHLDRYRIERTLGRGGVGAVVVALDPLLERRVAIKTLRLGAFGLLGSPGEMVEKVLDEARTLARFRHPHIVAIFDAGIEGDELPYIVMEYVDGPSLSALVRSGVGLTAASVAALGAAIASGLAAAHSAGVVHGDVQPGNVLLDREGAIKVSDFGFARHVSLLTRNTGQVFGVPGYVAPEVLLGEPADLSSDLFALGALLYFCLMNRPAFAGDTIVDRLRATCFESPLRPRTLHPEIPAEIERTVLGLLAKDPRERPSDAGRVADDLADLARLWNGRWPPRADLFDGKFESRESMPFVSSLLARPDLGTSGGSGPE